MSPQFHGRYIMHVCRLNKHSQLHNSSILAMNETSVRNDMVSSTNADKTGSKDVLLKTNRLEKVKVSVCLTTKCDNSKLKPFAVSAGTKRESKVCMNNIPYRTKQSRTKKIKLLGGD